MHESFGPIVSLVDLIRFICISAFACILLHVKRAAFRSSSAIPHAPCRCAAVLDRSGKKVWVQVRRPLPCSYRWHATAGAVWWQRSI